MIYELRWRGSEENNEGCLGYGEEHGEQILSRIWQEFNKTSIHMNYTFNDAIQHAVTKRTLENRSMSSSFRIRQGFEKSIFGQPEQFRARNEVFKFRTVLSVLRGCNTPTPRRACTCYIGVAVLVPEQTWRQRYKSVKQKIVTSGT